MLASALCCAQQRCFRSCPFGVWGPNEPPELAAGAVTAVLRSLKFLVMGFPGCRKLEKRAQVYLGR